MNDNPNQENKDLDELRRLLVGSELERLRQLTELFDIPDNFSSEVGEVLPSAIEKSARKGEQLSEAMLPTVEQILRLSIKRDIDKIADALFPVIGPAIRKSIKDAFRQMNQALNQTLENSFSAQGFKWRFESMRTGIPFSQIALLQSMIYRVEQGFLIHKKTGLLLNHVMQEDIDDSNADLVSSMLSAIESFVDDSFQAESSRTLDSIEVGELSIWIEQSPEAILAVAIRGEAPGSLRTVLKQTLEKIQLDYGKDLIAFDGDIAEFATTREVLMNCLQAKYRKTEPGGGGLSKYILILPVILLLYWIGTMIHQSMQHDGYISSIESEPGYVITNTYQDAGKLVIKGLRDPLSKRPETLLKTSSLNADQVDHRFEPYQSLQTEFIGRRANRLLEPPDTVSLRMEGDRLVVAGIASVEWREKLAARVPMIIGISTFDDSGLQLQPEPAEDNPADTLEIPPESVAPSIEEPVETALISSPAAEEIDIPSPADLMEERLATEIAALEQEIVFFEVGRAVYPGADDIQKITNLAQSIAELADNLARKVKFTVRGFSDSAGNYEENVALSLERAEHVAQVLIQTGINPDQITVKGLEEPVAEEGSDHEKRYNRRVIFGVNIE